jgi:PncC family amidohydrolase
MAELIALGELVADQLKANKQTVAVAESAAGGLISSALLAVPGASAYYLGGSVVYTKRARKQILGVTAQDVEGIEPVTEAMAAKFAQIAREQVNATWGLSELGIAGPTPARYGHPAGTCVIAVNGPVSLSATLETQSDDREENMWRFARATLELLAQAIEKQS